MAGPKSPNPLYALAGAARGLVANGQIDGELALSYIVWPSEEIAHASGVEMRELAPATSQSSGGRGGQGSSPTARA